MIKLTNGNSFKKQHTINREVSFEGIGLHTGKYCKLKLLPAFDNAGINIKHKNDFNIYKLSDLEVTDTAFGTTINCGDYSLATIEHLLSALYGTGIDNVIIEFEDVEVPILDGSSKIFVEKILEAGLKEQNANKIFIAFTEELKVTDGDKYIIAKPSQRSYVDVSISFQEKIIGDQRIKLDINEKNYQEIIGISRTFCRERDIKMIKHHGLGKGGSVENAILIDGDKMINESGLRHSDEFVAHKLLDFLGDFYILGYNFIGDVKMHKTGHTLNEKFVSKIKKYLQRINSFEKVAVMV